MNCLRHALHQTLDHGYAHHIQRLTTDEKEAIHEQAAQVRKACTAKAR